MASLHQIETAQLLVVLAARRAPGLYAFHGHIQKLSEQSNHAQRPKRPSSAVFLEYFPLPCVERNLKSHHSIADDQGNRYYSIPAKLREAYLYSTKDHSKLLSNFNIYIKVRVPAFVSSALKQKIKSNTKKFVFLLRC